MIRSMELNKTTILPDVILTIIENRPTLAQCSKEYVVLRGLRSSDVKH